MLQATFLTLILLLVVVPSVRGRYEYKDDHWFYRSFSGITDIPGDIPKDAVGVYLNNNYITMLKAHKLSHLSVCTYMSFAYNSISTVEPGAFLGLSNLYEIWLKGNKLQGLQPDMFTGLDNLESLILSENFINVIPEGSFGGMPRLRKLYLYGNSLTQVRYEMFSSGLDNVEDLILTLNNIRTIEDGAFIGLGNLKVLWLDGNYDLTDIRKNAFLGLRTLEQLWLQNNKISSIPEGLFSHLSNLQELSLDNNELTEIKPGTFKDLESLSRLWLYDNKLTTLDSSIFMGIPRPIDLSIGLNPLHCDSRLCWMKRAKTEGWLSWITLEGRLWHPTCADGTDFEDVSLNCTTQVECGDPGGVDNAERTWTQWPYTVNTTFTYTCDSCFTGGGTITCQSNGQWTQKPKCEVITCHTRHVETDGTVKLGNFTCGTEVSCPAGWEVRGDPRMTCGPDGTFTGAVPECHEIEEEQTTISPSVTPDLQPITMPENNKMTVILIIVVVLLVVTIIAILAVFVIGRRHPDLFARWRAKHQQDHVRFDVPKVGYVTKTTTPDVLRKTDPQTHGQTDTIDIPYIDVGDTKIIIETNK